MLKKELQIGIVAIVLILSSFVVVKKASASVRVPILMYHYIANNPNADDKKRNPLSVSPEKFEQQMQYLADQGFTPITLDTYAAIAADKATAPAKPVILTFDDGYIDLFTNAFPVLRKHGFHAISFIPTGLIGGSYFLNWDNIRTMASTGLINFESHAVSHQPLSKMNNARLTQELSESKAKIESVTGYGVNFIAYPGGNSGGTVQQKARQLGYIGGLGTHYGVATGITMNMPRVRMNGGMSLSDFAHRVGR